MIDALAVATLGLLGTSGGAGSGTTVVELEEVEVMTCVEVELVGELEVAVEEAPIEVELEAPLETEVC